MAIEPTPTNHSENKKSNRILIIIIIILSVFCAILLWQYFELRKQNSDKASEIEYITDDRAKIQEELEGMLSELDSMETDNDSIRMELDTRKAEIEELLEKSKNKDYAIYKLRKETKTLRTIMKGYVVVIDSLNTLNIGLRQENEEVRTTLSQERNRIQQLQKTKQELSGKVEIASRLQAQSITAFGVKVKRDLTGKEIDRASRTDKIRSCFTLSANKVAEAGEKFLYLRIIGPDGIILVDYEDVDPRFEFEGMRGVYSDKMSINYQNTAKEYCLDWARPNEDYEFQSGMYEIAIYAENYKIGSISLELK